MNRTLRWLLVACCAAAPAAWADGSDGLDERQSYSYVRTLDGRATLASVGRGPGEDADLHAPLTQGDRISVERGARIEIALADRNLVRLAGDSALVLARVAFSADRDDRTTRLDLDEGEALLVVTEQALGDELPEVRTPGGTVFVHQPGTYRIRADADGGVELVVRDGYAELLTDRGSTVVRAGEAAWTTGDRWRPVEVGGAGSRSELERWGEGLEQQARVAATRTLHVEPEYAYAAAPLEQYGSWVQVDASWYWRPRVAVGWRPYWQGRWAWTPSGLTWVSSEPWGWLPYHYGTWSFLPAYGWAWRPGYVYSPAWVYWHIGSGWSGWCPVGYYTDFYRPYWGGGFRFGVYGWSGGSWGFYADWNFLPTGRLCARDAGPWRRRGHDLARTEGPNVPRGILTTDTRDLPRDRWDRPDELVRALERGPRAGRPGGGLAEVTDFVARRRDLRPDVLRAVERLPGDPSPRRATPLDPVVERQPRHADPANGAAWRTRITRGPADDRSASERLRRESSPAPGAPRVDSDGAARRWQIDDRRGGTPPQPQSPPSPRAPAPAGADRQAWKLRGGWSDRGASERGVPDAAPRPFERDSDAPVRRVVDGVRRIAPPGETPSPEGFRVGDRGERRADDAPQLRFREPQPRAGETPQGVPPGQQRWVLPPAGGREDGAGTPPAYRTLPAPAPGMRRVAPPTATPPSQGAPRPPQSGPPPTAQGSGPGRGQGPATPPPSAQRGQQGRRSAPSAPPPPPPRNRGDGGRGHD